MPPDNTKFLLLANRNNSHQALSFAFNDWKFVLMLISNNYYKNSNQIFLYIIQNSECTEISQG